jgi:hypothetical protein
MDAPHEQHADAPMRAPITLAKGGHRWVFRCEVGQERVLVSALAELAERSDCPLDWFDASLVAHELETRLNDPAPVADA